MTPVEVIALSGCSRPEDGRPCKICVGQAEKHVRAVESAGLAVVSADDLRSAVEVLEAVNDPWRYVSEEPELLARLHAALLEEKTDG